MSEGLVEAARRLAGLVQAMGRPAAIIGGLAMIARVRARATQDVDALVSLEQEDVDTFVRLAREHGYDPGSTPERDLREMGLLRLWGPPGRPGGTIADIIVADSPHLLEAVRRAARVPESKLELPVATVEDLVVMKLDAIAPSTSTTSSPSRTRSAIASISPTPAGLRTSLAQTCAAGST